MPSTETSNQIAQEVSAKSDTSEYSFEACQSRLLVAISSAEQGGFYETRKALEEVLSVLIEEFRPTVH